MKYAVNKLSGKIEFAESASCYGKYICHECKAPVNLRSGPKRKAYFAHWRGFGSPKCENFVPGNSHSEWQGTSSPQQSSSRMELRLIIPSTNNAAWYLELTIPRCNKASATVTIDVGGRFQILDMRGMSNPRSVTAELTSKPYRIVEFSGLPDPHFVHGVEKECKSLRVYGASVFTSVGDHERNGFSRAKELRYSETFAMVWSQPSTLSFPDEIDVDVLPHRGEWHLALVTIPEHLSTKNRDWLREFTGLDVSLPHSSIEVVWPFDSFKLNIDEVECEQSSNVLLVAKNLSQVQQSTRTEMRAISQSDSLSVASLVGVNKFFAFTPHNSDFVSLSLGDNSNTHKFLSFSEELPNQQEINFPTVDIVFKGLKKEPVIFQLHSSNCLESVREAIRTGYDFDYLSIPNGVEGRLKTYFSQEQCLVLKGDGGEAPHNNNAFVLGQTENDILREALNDRNCTTELNFGGFGCLYFSHFVDGNENDLSDLELPASLRQRLVCYMSQLSLQPNVSRLNDIDLVSTFAKIKPKKDLIPHYRLLSRDIVSCGHHFEFTRDIFLP
ncbi:hypothetical protein [Vibrio harveyi]|uniref:hypothetical protein n=1 Tax=Vibrio harveyi TaxID=669 RepID=UPI0024B836F1|nr:hypothetical protein [Vibrio harveyi]WHP62146.1 hypothetical protein QMY49_11615 [Vibrio harveyi]